MGFESSHMARRRLAVLAMSHQAVHDALAAQSREVAPVAIAAATAGEQQPSLPFADLGPVAAPADGPPPLVAELEGLAYDILHTPGAGGALIAAYAEQARLLALVAEAATRAPDAPLPRAVRQAVVRATRRDPLHGVVTELQPA